MHVTLHEATIVARDLQFKFPLKVRLVPKHLAPMPTTRTNQHNSENLVGLEPVTHGGCQVKEEDVLPTVEIHSLLSGHCDC